MRHEENELILRAIGKGKSMHWICRKLAIDDNDVQDYVSGSVTNARTVQDGEALEVALLLAGYSDSWFAIDLSVLLDLLAEDWHRCHEDIVAFMQVAREPLAVDAICRAAQVTLPYMEYNQGYSMVGKCVHALAAIGTPDAIECLRLLSQSPSPICSEYAQRIFDHVRGTGGRRE